MHSLLGKPHCTRRILPCKIASACHRKEMEETFSLTKTPEQVFLFILSKKYALIEGVPLFFIHKYPKIFPNIKFTAKNSIFIFRCKYIFIISFL